MNIRNISKDVRIVYYGAPSHNIRVEFREVRTDGVMAFERWYEHWNTNEMSNDYAYSQALSVARSLANDLNFGRKVTPAYQMLDRDEDPFCRSAGK